MIKTHTYFYENDSTYFLVFFNLLKLFKIWRECVCINFTRPVIVQADYEPA